MNRQIALLILWGILTTVGNAWGQNSLTLTFSATNPFDPSQFFDGVVFRVGTAVGDASTYARFTGSGGTQSFQIVSPGENNAVKTITENGFFNIRPVSNMVINASLVRGFNGVIVGSNPVTVKDMGLTTNGISPNNGSPGTSVTITYLTNGVGTIPVNVSFKAQILINGSWQDMPNSATQYPNTARENFGYSKGDPRFITATIPNGLSAGSYQIRTVTTGADQTVVSSSTATFTVANAFTINTPTITTAPNSAGYFCPDTPVQVTFTVSGSPNSGNTYKVQRTDKDGNGAYDLPTTGSGTTLTATLSVDNFLSDKYRIRIASSNPQIYSSWTNPITISRPTGPNESGFGRNFETTLTYCSGQSRPTITPVATNGATSSSFVWYNNSNEEIIAARGQASYVPSADGRYQVQQTALGCNSTWSRYTVAANTACTPNAPSTLTANAVASSEINLVWIVTAGSQTGYELERSLNGTTWTNIAKPDPTVTSYKDTGLTPGTLYYYRIRSVNSANNVYSGYVTASATTYIKTTITLIEPLNTLCEGNNATAFQWRVEDDGKQAGKYKVNVYTESATSTAASPIATIPNTGNYGTFQQNGNLSAT